MGHAKYRLTLGLLVCLTMACQSPPETPAQVVGAFHAALAQRDLDRAVYFLAPEVRASFAHAGERLAKILELEAEDPLVFFLAGAKAEVANPLLGVETIEIQGDRAEVRVTAGDCRSEKPVACKDETLRLRRVDGRWTIEAEMPPGIKSVAEKAQEEKK